MQKILCATALFAASTTLLAQDCQNLGASLGSGDEVVFAQTPLGFAFPLGGVTYTDVHVSTNGHMYLSNAGVPAPGGSDYTPTQAEFAAGSPRVAALWTDLNMIAGDGGEVFLDNSSGVFCTITWQNAQNYYAGSPGNPLFDVQAKLWNNGDVEFFYTANATNYSSIATGQPGIVGVTPGQGVVLPASSDLSAGGVSLDASLFEEWLAPQTFDLNNDSMMLTAVNPGYVFAANGPSTNCSSIFTYGDGCLSRPDAVYELMTLGGWDVTNAFTLLRTSSEYTLLDLLPGVYVPPTFNAVVVSSGDDAYATMALSVPMPTVGGTTSSLTVCTNGYIALSPNQPSPVADYSPSVGEFEAFSEPVICGPWYDWSPNQGGTIWFEEIAGIAYVTWDNVIPYNSGVGDTFQFQFDLVSGNCTIVYQTMNMAGAEGWHTPLLGYTSGNSQSSESHDMSVELATQLVAYDTGALSLDANKPILGANWDLTTTNVDPISPVAITFFGDGQPPFPIPLPTIGLAAPGCFVNINTILGDLTGINFGGTATVSFPIPNNPAFIGAVLTAQSVCLTLATPVNLLTSNGVQGQFGY